MLKSYKYRLYPTGEQKRVLAQTFGCARLLYNSLLDWWKTEYTSAKAEERPMETLPLVTVFKTQYPFMRDIDSLALMNARRNFQTALKNFFDSKSGKRKGRKVGFPDFKRKGKCTDSYTTNSQDGTIAVDMEVGMVKLPKVKWVKCVLHRPLPDGGRIIRATVSRNKAGQYHVSVLVEIPETEISIRRHKSEQLKVVGIDLSMDKFAVSSDAEDDVTKAKYVRLYRKAEKRIARLNRTHSRRELVMNDETGRKTPSKNREKARLRLAKAHLKVANRRNDFTWKMARHYACKYDVIVLEDIDLQAMARTLHLGKSVNDLGFGMFRTRLEWKCAEFGSEVVYADKWFPSSKTCNHCGAVNKDLSLSDREWVCPECGCIVDRDYNAACNLRDWFFEHINEIYSTDGTAGIHACGDSISTSGTPLMQAGSMKQESSMGDHEAPTYSKWG